jgi:hypothetical protein
MTEKKPPVWLLDIDGVINATSSKIQTHIWPESEWTRQHVDGFQITAARRVLDFIRAVHAEGLADIRWHTTWQDRALDVGAAFGLPEFEVQDCPEWPPTSELVAFWMKEGWPKWWKYKAAERILTEEKRPLLWTDDDIFSELNAVRRQELKSHKLGVCLVTPFSMNGLDSSNLRVIEKWLKSKNR